MRQKSDLSPSCDVAERKARLKLRILILNARCNPRLLSHIVA